MQDFILNIPSIKRGCAGCAFVCARLDEFLGAVSSVQKSLNWCHTLGYECISQSHTPFVVNTFKPIVTVLKNRDYSAVSAGIQLLPLCLVYVYLHFGAGGRGGGWYKIPSDFKRLNLYVMFPSHFCWQFLFEQLNAQWKNFSCVRFPFSFIATFFPNCFNTQALPLPHLFF